jgi:hypothetical protein
MIKKLSIITFLSVGALYFAQDASVIKNTAEIYSSSNYGGTAKFNSMAGSMGALGGDLSVIAVNPAATGVFITRWYRSIQCFLVKQRLLIAGKTRKITLLLYL